jgi:hypothetical protein
MQIMQTVKELYDMKWLSVNYIYKIMANTVNISNLEVKTNKIN